MIHDLEDALEVVNDLHGKAVLQAQLDELTGESEMVQGSRKPELEWARVMIRRCLLLSDLQTVELACICKAKNT